MKLKLSKPSDPNAPPSVPPTPSAPAPSGSGSGSGSGSSGGFKLKLKSSQPSTPANEYAPASLSRPTLPPPPLPPPPPATKAKRPYTKKAKATDPSPKKRSAQDDISPAAKRPNTKKLSIKLGGSNTNPLASGSSAKVKAAARKQAANIPRNFSIVSRKAPPKRPIGVGYDSEASDAEDDPAIEQQFVLRMEPGRDCDYLRNAIANKTLGEKPEAGGAFVNLRFLDKDLRRAIITIDQTNYAAIMVDLPCIIEGMKSWDKRGWWKVADICQMLLVLGPTTDENTAKLAPLPREIDKHTYAYAHGLTPPMHWVRRRRFRKRSSYKTIEHVDDEVERLLKLDQEVESGGGNVRFDVVDQDALDAQRNTEAEAEAEAEYYEDEEPSQYLATTEDSFGQAMFEEQEEEMEDEDLEGMLNAALADEEEEAAPPLPLIDHATTLGAVQSLDETAPPTPQASDPTAPDQASSSDDEEEESEEDEEAASPDTIDEDLVAQQAQDAQVREEIEDLEKEVENARQNIEKTKNPMLRLRAVNSLRSLESELAMKRRNFGMEVDEDEGV